MLVVHSQVISTNAMKGRDRIISQTNDLLKVKNIYEIK